MEIDKNKDYEIVVFPNQDEGLKAQQVLITKDTDFKHISTLAVVIPGERRQEICRILLEEDILISGYYKFLYRDYEKDFFNKAKNYKPACPEGEFLKSITLCYVAPCMADEKKIRLIAYFDRDITEILPYLNAVIKGASYNKNAPTLTYTKSRRIINLYNIKVTIAKANDILDAWEVLDEIKDLINKTYQNRENIKPNYEEKIKITALQIYGWLPKTNCRICGEATCLAFAVKFLQGEQKLESCLPLSTDLKFSENKNIMYEMAEALGI
ncbi:MAG: (Fe-S)-binding protein [Candidatus Omnitrophica bacterium]|nr:(Fe-S)-binding protein [Candidatus Omnitrophota bacterium]MDD5352109.1 (Fe-S)-binding protein [Candidatus Omnitrophota bacterium]MDD5549707.1 (Fe-S)-binding protein [Candidatus Omnitrophota bacterium]